MNYQSDTLLFLILLTLNSCNYKHQEKHPAKTENFSKVIPIQSYSKYLQTAFDDFLKKQNQIDFIKYRVRRIDTLVSGNTRSNSGNVTLARDKKDSIFNLSFKAIRDSSSWENYYLQYTHFEVSTKSKFYRKEPNYKDYVFGTEGGQLVIPDLLNLDTANASFDTLKSYDKCYIVQMETKYGSLITIKKLKINKNTSIPVQINYTEKNKNNNWKYSTDFFITEVQINDEIINNELSNVKFKSGYSWTQRLPADSPLVLIGKEVPEIIFQTFENKSINLKSLESQIVLLDFWEIWCGPCINSLPKIQKIAQDYKPFGLFSMGIATDNIDEAKKYIIDKNYDLNQAVGNKELKSIFNINSYPRYILIDHKGLIYNVYYGFSEKIELDINNLLMN